MKLIRFLTTLLLFISLGLVTVASVRAEIVEGRDYTTLTEPRPTESGKNIEVLEFFWYGCPHCYDLHPLIQAWQKKAPKDVSFRYIPAVFRANWIPGTKTFYAMEALGIRERLHDKVYDAIHLDKIDLSKDELLFDWMARQGIERQKFVDTYNSFSVQNQATRSAQMSKDYNLSGVPALVVDGRYLTSGKMGGTPQDTIRALEELILKVRKERAKK